MAVGFLVLLLVLILLIAVAAMVSVQTFRKTAVTTPSCAACGYAVRGLTTFNCPECGSDLREVGIVTPTVASPGALLGKNVIGWTAFVLLCTSLGAVLVGYLFNVPFRSASADVKEWSIGILLGLVALAWLFGVILIVRDYAAQRRRSVGG